MLSFGTAVPTTNMVVSKKQFEEEGEAVGKFSGVGTGAWEFIESVTGQSWSFKAVEDHYRKTPEFAELVMWEIPEEATRVANFQTGKLDSFQMALDSKAAIDQTEDIRYMSVPNGATEHLGFYGNWYVGVGTDAQREGYDPSLPWVLRQSRHQFAGVGAGPQSQGSPLNRHRPGPDRRNPPRRRRGGPAAMDLGEPDPSAGSGPPEDRIRPGAGQAVAGGGRVRQRLLHNPYSSIRESRAEVEACEAISEMWEEIGLNTTINRVPYLSIGPQIQARTYNQASCHGTDGRIDPLDLYPVIFGSASGWSSGADHPILDQLIDDALAQIDEEGHFEAMNKAARFVYENVLETGFIVSTSCGPWVRKSTLGPMTWNTAPPGPSGRTNSRGIVLNKEAALPPS